jgi:hypothetical protein
MSASQTSSTASSPALEPTIQKRIILTMGGKGGVGKTGVTLTIAEWLQSHEVPFTLLDLDTENKARGSLKHYYREARKVNIHTPAGLDTFIDAFDDGHPILLADMGAGSGQVAHEWFDTMHESAEELGIAFTAIGIVTPDPASVESVLSWARELQHKVQYLIVENETVQHADFSYWRESEQAEQFRQVFSPVTITMKYRIAELENPSRQHGVTLGQVAGRAVDVAELRKSSIVARAQSYQRQLFAEIDRARELLLP